MRTLVWFRGKDLRLADHVPLREAIAGGEVIPLFVLDPAFFAPERARAMPHRIQFLLESLAALAEGIARAGSCLVVARGKSVEVVPRLARRWRADRVVGHRWCEPFARERDRRVAGALAVPFDLFEGETLVPPGTLRTRGGAPFSVFTPFARAFAAATAGGLGAPLPAPRRLPPLPAGVRAPPVPIPTCADLGIEPNPRLQRGGEAAARARLAAFLAGPAARYGERRAGLDPSATSRLSADLKFGTLSAREVWSRAAGVPAFAAELVWRELAHSTLWDRPDVLVEPFRPAWKAFPWRRDARAFRAWWQGRTGYPIVDAAARQLLAEGFVPNRARMIAASFLVKHLLLDFRLGEAHYQRWLTDGDWAQNDLNWQWCAGCGCDAQPYFRIFNPVAQGRRFDPDGAYVRRWIPELARVPAEAIHAPWEAPPETLRAAGVRLGRDYPRPIVDHAFARARFLSVARGLGL